MHLIAPAMVVHATLLRQHFPRCRDAETSGWLMQKRDRTGRNKTQQERLTSPHTSSEKLSITTELPMKSKRISSISSRFTSRLGPVTSSSC